MKRKVADRERSEVREEERKGGKTREGERSMDEEGERQQREEIPAMCIELERVRETSKRDNE